MGAQGPSGNEIAAKARNLQLDRGKVAEGVKDGKNVKFTAARLDHVRTLDEMEKGQVIGVLENEIEGDESGLPAGQHNVYLANVDGVWRAYAESGGEIVGEAARVQVDFHALQDRKIVNPEFRPDGWCYCYCLISCWGICLWAVCIYW